MRFPIRWVKGRGRAFGTVAALVVLASPPPALAEQQIGGAAVVVNNVTGTLASSRQRSTLRAGLDVFQNEVIDTADNSASRVVFQDRSELSIGPMSQVTLDRFVFDPNPSNSQVAVSLAKGVARFSSGLLPKTGYQLNTPAAAIGLRGTTVTMIVSASRTSIISVQAGAVVVTAQGVTVTVNAGQTTTVAFGSPPTQPVATPPSPGIVVEMDRLLRTAAVPGASPGFGVGAVPGYGGAGDYGAPQYGGQPAPTGTTGLATPTMPVTPAAPTGTVGTVAPTGNFGTTTTAPSGGLTGTVGTVGPAGGAGTGPTGGFGGTGGRGPAGGLGTTGGAGPAGGLGTTGGSSLSPSGSPSSAPPPLR